MVDRTAPSSSSAPFETRLAAIVKALQAMDVVPALAQLRALAPATNDGRQLQHIAQSFTRLNRHREAADCYRRSLATQPRNPEYLYNLATAEIALGNMAAAELLLDHVIALAPHDYDAYYNRATLRKQTTANNHVADVEKLLAAALTNPAGEAALGYALAKELEDLAEYRHSFAALKRGGDGRKRLLSYRVDEDVRAMDAIAGAFGVDFFAKPAEGHAAAAPIFILGLPRSGTTLVDRILSAHSDVESLGEISNFASALMRATPSAKNKFELIAATAKADLAAVGRAYVESMRALADGGERLIDKTPLNFLYTGLITRALPNATIVHVRRGAMDVCYAMYKTLFRMAYPFSYDLGDLAAYYLSYRKLMMHWQSALPGRIVEIRYEDIVSAQEATTRKLIADCGLAWEDACLSPEANAQPSLTASASQVRQKVYSSSVGLWRNYTNELQPLARVLAAGGIDIETE